MWSGYYPIKPGSRTFLLQTKNLTRYRYLKLMKQSESALVTSSSPRIGLLACGVCSSNIPDCHQRTWLSSSFPSLFFKTFFHVYFLFWLVYTVRVTDIVMPRIDEEGLPMRHHGSSSTICAALLNFWGHCAWQTILDRIVCCTLLFFLVSNGIPLWSSSIALMAFA